MWFKNKMDINVWCIVTMWSVLLMLVIVPVDSSLIQLSDVPQNYTNYPCTDQNHLVLVPGALAAGGNSRACISRFHPDGPAHVVLTLRAGQETTAGRELPPGDGGCLDLPVPLLPNTKAELIVNIRYPEAHCTWERRLSVRISSGKVVVLQTERARYRPGDTIRARVLVLKADLAPVHGSVEEIWLEGPRGAWEGTRAAQWLRVRTRLGIGQVQHELDAQAPPGRWTLRARLEDGSQGASEFWVGNYEIPPFQLSVRHAARILRSSERLVWTVCVRYPWTEAVEGMLVIRLRGAGGNFDSDETPGVRTAVRLRAPKACHRHAIAARRIGLDGSNPPDVVVADFSFQEDGTRIWQNTTVVSQVVDKAVTLEFLTKHRAVIAPGLPYKLKIRATRWDDKPAANELIRVCRAPSDNADASACDDAVSDARGIARVMFTADDSNVLYKFQATLSNDSSVTSPPLLLPARRTGAAHAALGPLRDAGAARGLVPLYLSGVTDTALTVHFVVITRGGIIYRWGVTTQCPISSTTNQIYTASRNSRCPQTNLAPLQGNSTNPAGGVQENSSDLLDRHLLRVMLPVKVTHQMCPDSHLIAYFYYKGELVSASKHIEMEECFANKVEASWLSRQVAPGASTSLSLTTHGLALCALSVVDSAARWLDPAPSAKDAIMERLRNLIDGHRNLTEYDAAGECFLTTDSTDTPTTSLELTLSWLAAGGVRAAGGGGGGRACGPAPAPLRADVSAPRTDFSEAWLWRLVAVGANGSVVTSARAPDSITKYEATALCVARTGVAVSAPAALQVFREFFIHADSPKRLRRGDTTIIQYRIFNYLYEPLNVEIQVLADPHLEVPVDRAEAASVAARASVARRVQLRAVLPGAARVALRARAPERGVSDEIIIQIQVDPEGVPAQDYQSALLCGRDSPVSRTSAVSWSWPQVDAVPGSESVTVWAIGDITGPLLADADSLVLLPRGCGEQNMARLATNLLALKQLDPTSTAATSAKEHVARGFTRQLQYVHPSGGFSAFGASDDPSTWLTAFTIRYLKRAHEVISPGLPAPPALRRAERWLMSQQMENGCFRNEGQVFHRELKGGLNEDGEIANVALTAYVITSLVEGASDLPYKVLRNTLSCLRALPPLKTKSPTRVYAHAVLAYAFMRLRRYEEELRKTNEASPWENEGLEQDEDIKELVELMKMARRKGEYVWWETSSLATSVEATGYALLALASCPGALAASCAYDARGATRWLAARRSAGGGFVATQDTLVALEALTTWAATQPPAPVHLNVTARSPGVTSSVTLTSEVRVPELLKATVGKLDVTVEGSGCALVQATRAYHTLTPAAGDKQLSLQVSARTEGAFNCDANGTNCFCAAVVEACVMWTGPFPEMALLDISLPGGYGADAALLYAQLQTPNTILRRIELSASAGRATLYLAARGAARRGDAHRCFSVHATGPAARTQPAAARLQDYYVPAHNHTRMYTIPEDCPSKISPRNNDYLRSDNLFSKSISEDTGDILITDEFSFEDIPDGIPLEDPLYDNLTQIDDDKSETGINTDEAASSLEKDVENPVTTTDGGVRKSKLESENEIIRIDDKIERNFDSIDDQNPVNKENKKEHPIDEIKSDSVLESKAAENTVQLENTVAKAENTVQLENKHRIEIRDDTRQEEAQTVDNPKLSSFHVIDSEKDLDVPTGVEGPVPVSVLPPPDFVSVPPFTVSDSAAFPSIQIQTNPKAFYSYPPYTYYIYTEIPRRRYRYIYK